MHTVLNFLNAAWDFIVGFFPYLGKWCSNICRKLFAQLCDGVVAAVSAIPVPDFVANASGLFSAVPGAVWWFASVFELQFGIGVVLAAFALRFALRALPFFF